jgi:hypothetical protein
MEMEAKCQAIQDSIEGYRDWRRETHNETEIESGEPLDCLNLTAPYLALIGEFQRSSKGMPKPSGATCSVLPRVKRFEAKQGQKLREAGAAMDSLVPSEDIGLCRAILLTIPANYHDAFCTVASETGWVMNRVAEYLRRHLKKPLWFYVWELQKRGALHLHFCFYAPTEEQGQKLGDGIIELWLKLLEEMSEKSGNDLYWSGRYTKQGEKYYVSRERLINSNQRVHTGCAGYFAKYSGKDSYGSARGDKGFGSRTVAHPRRIWGSSQAIKNAAKELAYTGSVELPTDEAASEFYESVRELVRTFRHSLGQCFAFDIKRERRLDRVNSVSDRCGRHPILEQITVAEGVTEVFYIDQKQFRDALAMLHLRFQSMQEELRKPMEDKMELPLTAWFHYDTA